ncbi:MAG TPA: serine hydrolase domain-containing protein [Flavisolibacter sp.]|jgi:CubicO group peptidase (beta-lactamase class C family)|nr:serine hydrolase domain-containing protein [Flavisolibacter sp.]
MHNTILSIVFLLLTICSQSQGSVSGQTDLQRIIQQKGDSLLAAEKLPGIFIGLLNGSSKQFFNFGYADPDNKIPFDSATIFEAGSITKTFTAYILETILQVKKISDTTSILPYLPDSVQTNSALSEISFLSLLNHTSGLPRLPDNLALTSTTPYDTYTAADLFAYLKRCTPKPDGKSSYSNLGAGLAGWLAERIAGKNFNTLLKTSVFHPFGMKDALAANSRKAQGYFGTAKRPFWNMNVLFPAGGVHCSANDLLNYLEGMSLPDSKREVQTHVIEKLLQPTVAITPAVHVSRAWHTLEQTGQPTIYWHNGGTYGFSAFAAFVKGTKQAVVVVVNQFNKNAVSDGLGIAILKKMLE